MASRSRRTSGGGAQKVIWFLVVAGLIFAFFQIPYDPGARGLYEIAQAKSKTVQNWVGSVDDQVVSFVEGLLLGGDSAPPTGGGGTGEGAEPNGAKPASPQQAAAASAALGTLPVAEASGSSYNRDEWSDWSTLRTCWDVREEVLSSQAKPGTAVYQDKDGKETTDKNRACTVVKGTWVDPYTGSSITDPSTIDIDHMIPLKYAATHGGQGWSADKKKQYANDLTYSNHLLAVSAGANRSKSDKGPASWKPDNKNHWCTYATDWVNITQKWGLSVSNADKQALSEMLGTCSR